MELNDAARRIVGQHWRTILVFVVSGVIAGMLLARAPDTYSASTRLLLGTGDPETKAESTAIADTARAIATSPSQVRDALRRARVTGRDPVKVAERHVSVSALGSSGVVQLSISDRSPRTAAAIANALAVSIIQTRLNASGRIQETLAALDRRIAELNRRIARADAASRASLLQQRGVVESERVSLLAAEALRPKPLIISRAGPPETTDPSHLVADALLGALLGVILGLSVAGLMEIIRPTLVGGDVLATEFGTSHLGTLRTETDDGSDDLARIATRLTLTARTAGVGNVSLLAVGPDANLGRLAERLEAILADEELDLLGAVEASAPTLPRSAVGSSHKGPRHHVRKTKRRPSLRIRPFRLETSSPYATGTGLALVVPTALKKVELLETKSLVSTTRLPLLGVITYRRSPTRRDWSAVVPRRGPATVRPVETSIEALDTELRTVQRSIEERRSGAVEAQAK